MSPEIQEWSHKSRSRINNLYLLTRPIIVRGAKRERGSYRPVISWNLKREIFVPEQSWKVETDQSSGFGTDESWTFSFPDS